MNNINNKKKALLLLWTYIVLFFTPKVKNNTKNEIVYNDNYIYEQTPYASYKDKLIYICGVEYIKNNKNIDNTDNIYIIDDRRDKDSDMSICNSYQIKSIQEINTLINLLIEYENNDPTIWQRSFKSMKNEWIIHNICYYLNIEKDRTKQVDFINDDEITYLEWLKILKEILNTNNSKLEKIETKVLVK